MVRAREDRIRTFMQLELKACLEEVSWSIRCYNCEVLGCPQEEYPARLLPTLPPDYEDNLINRLRAAQKGILPASLKMILNSDYQLPVLRSASQVSVQPDSVIGENRVEQHSTASECDLSPRHAAVVTRSEKLETPPKSPAIGTGLDRPPEYRRLLKPIHHKRMRACSRLKPVRMIFWIRMSQARSRRSLRYFINKTSG